MLSRNALQPARVLANASGRRCASSFSAPVSPTRIDAPSHRVGQLSLPEGRLTDAESREQIKKTALNAFHRANGGYMVEFAGWEMPLRYEGGDKSKVAGGPGERRVHRV